MSRILVPPEVLLRVAEQFEGGALHLEGMNKALNHSLSQMSGDWDGMTRERFYGDFQQAAREMNLTVEHMHQVHVELKRAAIKFRTLDNSMDPSAVDSGTLANFGGTSAAGTDGSTTAGTKGLDHTLLFTDQDDQTVAEFSSSSRLEDLIGEYQEDEEGNVTFAGQNGSQLSVNTDNLDHLLEQYKDEKEFFTRPEVLYAPRTGTADFLQYAVDKGYDPITFEHMDETPNPHAQNVVNFNRMRNVVSDQLHNEPIRIQIRDAADTGLNAIPVLGTIKGAVELYTGRSMVTNEELSTVQKGFTVASMMPLTAAFRPVGKMFKGAGKSVDDVVEGIGNAPVPIKPDGGSNPRDFVNPHSEKHLYDPSRLSTPNRSQYGKDVDVEKLRQETMTNPDKAFSNWPNPNNPNPNRITKYYKEFDGNISTPDTPTGSHRVFEHLDDPTRSSHFPYVPKNKE